LLIELWADFRRGRGAKRPALPLGALVCLILLALLTVAQVAHTHALQSDADHCQLCIVLHSAAPVAVATAVVVFVRIGSAAPASEPIAVLRHRHPKLYTRPPPVGC
jgi:hypothetical protein